MMNEANNKQIATIEEAVDFLKSQGFEVNPVDGIYRVRKAGWNRLPYELDAETVIDQANMLRNALTTTRGK